MRIRIIDLETTGFAPPEHAPVEVAWCDLKSARDDLAGNPTDFEQSEADGMLCDPLRPIPPESSAIHHIVDADVAGRIDWRSAVRLAAQHIAEPDVFAAHNAKFERQFVTDDLTGGKPWICTYKCALRLWPEAPGHGNMTLRYWRNPRGLDRARAQPAHRAGPDAYVTAHLLRDMLDHAPVETLIQWSSEPALLVRVPFGKSRGELWRDVDDGFIYWVLERDFDEDIKFTARYWLRRRTEQGEDLDI